MTNPVDSPITDDDLHALVDGQLDPDRLPALLAWLPAHPDAAQRLADWQAQRLALKRLHRETEPGETPAALLRSVQPRRRRAWTQAAAALGVLAVLAVGIAAGRLMPGPPAEPAGPLAAEPGFARDAVAAHAVYTPETRHPVEVAASDEAHLVQWLSRRLGAPLKVPVLQGQGFRLLGGRLLPGDEGPRAQFMYEDARGRRATLYLSAFAPGREPAETAFRSWRDGSVESFYWVEGRFGYALSGGLEAAELQALAREAYRQLAR